MRKTILIYFSLVFFSGCATTSKNAQAVNSAGESRADVVSAMTHVVSAVSGQEMTEKDLRKLNSQIEKDPQAKSAVQAITNSMSGQGQVVKYCPVDGERYSAKFETCPIHKVPLKIVSE